VNSVNVSQRTAFCCPAGVIVHLPFFIAVKYAHGLALELGLVPVPVITGVARFDCPCCAAKRVFSPTILLGAVVFRFAEAICTTPFLILIGILAVVLGKKSGVLALGDIKTDEPVRLFDDALCAIRYATYTYLTKTLKSKQYDFDIEWIDL